MNSPSPNAIIYARVSSREQEREGYSIPAQQKILREYAARNHFRIIREFVDVETAKTTGRKAFGEMLEFIRKNGSRVVLVEKTDRLYRNFRDCITLEDLDSEIHLVKEARIIGKIRVRKTNLCTISTSQLRGIIPRICGKKSKRGCGKKPNKEFIQGNRLLDTGSMRLAARPFPMPKTPPSFAGFSRYTRLASTRYPPFAKPSARKPAEKSAGRILKKS